MKQNTRNIIDSSATVYSYLNGEAGSTTQTFASSIETTQSRVLIGTSEIGTAGTMDIGVVRVYKDKGLDLSEVERNQQDQVLG